MTLENYRKHIFTFPIQTPTTSVYSFTTLLKTRSLKKLLLTNSYLLLKNAINDLVGNRANLIIVNHFLM